MKVGRQVRERGYIAAAGVIALLGFFVLVRAEPRAKAQAAATPANTVDYQRFFAPSTSGADTTMPIAPHTRTRAS